MTAEAIIETQEGAGGGGTRGDVVALPTRERTGAAVPAVVRSLAPHAGFAVPVLAATGAAAATGSGALAGVTVVSAWVAGHLLGPTRRLATGLPGAAELLHRMAVPLAAVALLVVADLVPHTALSDALAVVSLAAAALRATAAVGLRTRRRRVLVVGDPTRLGGVAAAWRGSREVDVVGAVAIPSGAAGADADADGADPAAGALDEAAREAERLRAEAVVVLPSADIGSSEVRRLAWRLEGGRTALAVCTDLGQAAPHRLAVTRLGRHAVVEVAPCRAPAHVRFAKCVVDRVGAAVLLVLLSPLLLGLVALVRLESRGPAIFTQTRIGRDGRPFKVLKLRTMCVQAEDIKGDLRDVADGNEVLFKVRRDPRITRIGRPLRRTSLDELPQLVNVLRGEMSLVGPRPALPDEVAQYDAVARRRLAVRPGLTGLWQVSGRSDLDWETAVALDVAYTDNVRLAEDLRICLRTVGAVTSGRGAY